MTEIVLFFLSGWLEKRNLHSNVQLENAVTPQRHSQFASKMKANAVPRLLSFLVGWPVQLLQRLRKRTLILTTYTTTELTGAHYNITDIVLFFFSGWFRKRTLNSNVQLENSKFVVSIKQRSKFVVSIKLRTYWLANKYTTTELTSSHYNMTEIVLFFLSGLFKKRTLNE